jgi:hypothetical protein
MLLIIFLGLVAKLTFVSGDCDVGAQEVKNFDYPRVGITVLTQILKQAA